MAKLVSQCLSRDYRYRRFTLFLIVGDLHQSHIIPATSSGTHRIINHDVSGFLSNLHKVLLNRYLSRVVAALQILSLTTE